MAPTIMLPGVSMMLEIAEKFGLTKGSHPRTIICVAFTGEEEGLLGSKYFTENSGIDLSKVNAMLNFDMLGRLQKTNIIQVGGVGTSEELKDIVTSLNDTASVKLALSEAGFGPSDHSAFYMKNVPVLFFTTGAHPDYTHSIRYLRQDQLRGNGKSILAYFRCSSSAGFLSCETDIQRGRT